MHEGWQELMLNTCSLQDPGVGPLLLSHLTHECVFITSSLQMRKPSYISIVKLASAHVFSLRQN